MLVNNENEAQEEQKCRFVRIILDTLGASLLGNMLAGGEVLWTGEGRITADEETNRAGQDF